MFYGEMRIVSAGIGELTKNLIDYRYQRRQNNSIHMQIR